MKITDIKTVLLTGPLTGDPYVLEAKKFRSAAFVEVHSDVGVTGIGETYAGYFFPESVPEIVEFFKPILIGQNVDNISELWERMYFCGTFWCRVGLGAIVVTAIEAALWDLKGKLEKKPAYELLGGLKHKRLPAYASGGPSNYPKEKLAKKVDYYQSLGFKGFKVGAGCFEDSKDWKLSSGANSVADFEGDKVAFLRKHCGPDVRICLDGHMGNSPFGTWDLATAKAVMDACAPYNLFFYEEPLPYTNYKDYAELTRYSKIPIAGGECLSTMSEWQVYIEHESFAVAQPDASYNGGLRHFLQIAKEWEKRGKKIATHSWGAGVSLMQNVHGGFAAGNTCTLEIAPNFAGLHKDIIGDSFQMKDGYVLPPQTYGLGLQLTAAIKARYPFRRNIGEFNSVPGKVMDS